MSSDLPDETVIREYLLGTLPEQDWEKIEEKLLSDKEFADFVECIEDEIIEEYLAIHNHFLRPPERQRKLLFASALHSKLKKEQRKQQQAAVPIDLPRRLPPARTSRPYVAAMIGAAAVLLLSTMPLALYTARLHRDLGVAKARTNEIESSLVRVTALAKSIRNDEILGNPGVVSLWPPNRDIQKLPVFQATSHTKSLEVDIHLNPSKSSAYDVDLQIKRKAANGNEVEFDWSKDDLHHLQPTDNVLVFRIPYFGQGRYSLRVTGNAQPAGAPVDTYHFDAVETPSPSSKH